MLLLDDEAAVRRAMRNALAHFGCRVAEAGSSEEALAQVASFKPGLVLADWQLRDGDSGLLAVQRLRERLNGLPAILISGDTDAALRRGRCGCGPGVAEQAGDAGGAGRGDGSGARSGRCRGGRCRG
ncbi:MAG: response regulator [Rubrivivax sp.]